MKKSFWLFASLFLLSVVFTTTSCNEDDGMDPSGNDLPPSITLDAQPPTQVSVLGSQITASISVVKGDNPIKTLTVQENGVDLDFSRVEVEGIGANPILVAGDAVNGLTWDILIDLSDQCGFYTFTIIAADDQGLTSETSFSLDLQASSSPFITFNNNPVTSVTSQGQVIDLDIAAIIGELPLTSVTILENGIAVDASRVEYDGITGNPIAVNEAEENGFDWVIKFAAQSEFDTRTYTIQLLDECGLTNEISFDLTVESGTAITNELNGVLFNQAGPAGNGALDLDTGLSCGVTTDHPTNGTVVADTEIRDMGINTGLPNDQNWRTQMGPMTDNGATMRMVDLTQVEGFNFDNVTTVEEIIGAYDTGIDLTEEVDGNTATNEVFAGDLFVVQRGGINYLIRVDLVTKTISDNQDSYTLSIKY